MRSAVNALFFLAMLPLGLMAAEIGHRTSNVQDPAAEGDAQHLHFQECLQQSGARAGVRGHRGLVGVQAASLLKLHNEARCLHNANDLTYSNKVATSANAHAQVLSKSCGNLFHSSSGDRNGYGENLYLCGTTSSTSCYTPAKAMTALYDDEITGGSVTGYGGHATQILWKSTTQLGCATSTCDLDSFHYVYLVCQYNPAGNNLAILNQQVELPSSGNC